MQGSEPYLGALPSSAQCRKGPTAAQLQVRCLAPEEAARAEGWGVAAEQERGQISPAAQHNPADAGAP